MYYASELKRLDEGQLNLAKERAVRWLSDQMDNPFCIAALARGDAYRINFTLPVPQNYIPEIMKAMGEVLRSKGFTLSAGYSGEPKVPLQGRFSFDIRVSVETYSPT